MPKTTIGGSATDNTVGSGKYELNSTPGARVVQELTGTTTTTITNTDPTPMLIVVGDGSFVNSIEFSRDEVTFDLIDIFTGSFFLGPGDSLRINHSSTMNVMKYPL